MFTWPPEKPVGQLEFPSLCGMTICVLKDNCRVEFEGGLSTLGDSAPTALNEPGGGATVTLLFLAGFEINCAVELLY